MYWKSRGGYADLYYREIRSLQSQIAVDAQLFFLAGSSCVKRKHQRLLVSQIWFGDRIVHLFIRAKIAV